jgi:hypothetical protein
MSQKESFDSKNKIIKDLLNKYFNLFSNDGLFPEWNDASFEDKKEMLQEAIKKNKDISETKIFKEKYEEKIKR